MTKLVISITHFLLKKSIQSFISPIITGSTGLLVSLIWTFTLLLPPDSLLSFHLFLPIYLPCYHRSFLRSIGSSHSGLPITYIDYNIQNFARYGHCLCLQSYYAPIPDPSSFPSFSTYTQQYWIASKFSRIISCYLMSFGTHCPLSLDYFPLPPTWPGKFLTVL